VTMSLTTTVAVPRTHVTTRLFEDHLPPVQPTYLVASLSQLPRYRERRTACGGNGVRVSEPSSAPTPGSDVREFTITVAEAVLDELRERLARTRWPDPSPTGDWAYGTELAYLQELCDYWQNEFDWRQVERRLNAFDQFMATIRGQRVHFLHVRSAEPSALPLLLVHGWPGSITEFLKILGPLTDPAAHGGNPADAFHIVVPSIPGFGFSGVTSSPGVDVAEVADIFAELMELLHYPRYGAQGGDWGSMISRWVGLKEPDRVVGVHVNFLTAAPPDPSDPTAGITSPEELADLDYMAQYQIDETGYLQIQGSKPQSLAYGLTDSPAGLAAWILEKFRTWSDCDGDVERVFTKDELLANITLYWVTGTINSSMRIYYESRRTGRSPQVPPLEVPLGYARFPKEIRRPPRAWLEAENPTLHHWTSMPRGGHFAAMETPDLLVDDIRTFFRPLRGG
jgi:pimeloyl-ACP methyl ester carboxylesterase